MKNHIKNSKKKFRTRDGGELCLLKEKSLFNLF